MTNPLIKIISRERDGDHDSRTDEQVLGQIVAHYAGWSGNKIIEIAAEALEDSNFHGEAEKVLCMRQWMGKVTK